jgi:flagellar hook-length control protein FliK
MIIPGNALLALLSPPQELQGMREGEDGFGVLLTAIASHDDISGPEQEEAERQALDSVLQVLMSLFQSCPPVNGVPAASAPGTEESGAGSTPLAAGLRLGLPRQESTQDWRGRFMAQPTVALSVSIPTAEFEISSGTTLPATTPSASVVARTLSPEAEGVSPEFLPTSAATVLPQRPPAAPVVEPTGAANTRPLLAAEQVSQSTILTSPPSPGDAVPAMQWVGQAAAPPITEAPVPLPTIPQAEIATTSHARAIMVLAQEAPALPEHKAFPASRPRPENQERVAATVPSIAPLATDSVLPLASPRATSHMPVAEPAIAVPALSPTSEDMARPWSRPFPANMVVLHLEPQELGALRLQVRVHDKRLIASFQAQSPEVETLLRTHLPGLHESLSQHGFEVQSIAITRAVEGFSAHMGTGTGAFAHQHSAFHAFAAEQHTANAGEAQSEVELHSTPRWPSERRSRLLDVVI